MDGSSRDPRFDRLRLPTDDANTEPNNGISSSMRAQGLASPGLSPLSPRVSANGSVCVGGRATLRQRPTDRVRESNSRRFFSTDDDETEVEQDLDREYQEGYIHGLRERRRRQASRASIGAESPLIAAQTTAVPENEIGRNSFCCFSWSRD
jgi:hypothetical protein